ncbi:MAG: 16S rRNA processing protein RimM, partial [Maribacter sp.]|nr:16S rRNA processing protein RimM [Maribacter sp.]
LIPVNDDIVTKIDRENKSIFVKTPEGLVDLYLS